MSDSVVGNCLHLYLENYALLWSLEEHETLPSELKDQEQLLSSFRQRASDQAAALLEHLYSQLLTGTTLPYRLQRKSQRRTVRDQWQMDGYFLRPREKMPRNFWSLYLGSLRDKGPAACLVLGPNEPDSPASIDALANQAAALFGIESANARTCFGHDSSYECGTVIGLAALTPATDYDTVGARIKEHADLFFGKHKALFEQSLGSA